MQYREEIRCPKCNSINVHFDKKGFSFGKAVVGAILINPVGVLAGVIGSNKIKANCLACGYSFDSKDGYKKVCIEPLVTEKIEKSNIQTIEISEDLRDKMRIQKSIDRNKKRNISVNSLNNNKIKCSCGALNEMHFKYCRNCGKSFDDNIEYVSVKQILQYKKCPHCFGLTPSGKSNKYCVRCGVENK